MTKYILVRKCLVNFLVVTKETPKTAKFLMVGAYNIFPGCVQSSRNHSANEQKWFRNDSALGNFWSLVIFGKNLQSREREKNHS